MKVSTLTVAHSQQAQTWQSAISDVYVPLEFRPLGRGGFTAELEVHRIDDLDFSRVRSDPHAVVRSPDGAPDGDTVFVMIPRSGHLHVEQDGRETDLRPGDLTCYDATRSCLIESHGAMDLTIAKVPTTAFRAAGFPLPPADATAVRVDRESPLGSLAAPYLTRLAELGREHAAVGARATTLGLLSSALAGPSDDGRGSREALRLRAERVVREHLGDPELDPAGLAAAVHVSLRTLQMAFAEVGQSPARFLLTSRVERAAALLTDPTARSRTITEIAFAVGFSDSSQFSRSFRAVRGCSPREHRLRESANVAAPTRM